MTRMLRFIVPNDPLQKSSFQTLGYIKKNVKKYVGQVKNRLFLFYICRRLFHQ